MRIIMFVCAVLLLLSSALLAGPNVGQPAPNFSLPDTGYTYHSLSDYQYDVVLLMHGQTS